ncbi:MAG TPA: hypothetical protein VJU61_16655 [Polyangiaceae bacterium]|nr:hypothetical protein [Polyangiaceae bacterium]
MPNSVSSWLAVVSCLLACSNDDDAVAGSCAPVEPCGGEIASAWQVQSLCFAQERSAPAFEAGLPPECAGAFSNAEASVDGGALEYAAEGTWTSAGAAKVHAQYHLTEACTATVFPDPDTPTFEGRFCSIVASRLFAQLTELEPGEGTIACFGSGPCDCDLSAVLDLTGSGTYSTDNGQVISGSSSAAYCVSGDQLRYEAVLGGDATAARR